jgi:hypothetical protein
VQLVELLLREARIWRLKALEMPSDQRQDGAIRLDAESIDEIARRVAELLRPGRPGRQESMLTAAEVAADLGVSRTWVYENAKKLGGIRLGTGRRARLRFDRERVAEWRRPTSVDVPADRVHSSRRAAAWLDDADLIPIRAN